MKRANGSGAFIGSFNSPSGRTRVLLEDDGRDCYAYILDENDEICGDVWLYNRCQTPVAPEWHSRENLPFANPAEFSCQNSDFGVPRSAEEFSVKWVEIGNVEVARIYLSNRYFAKLVHGAKPGWSLLAAKDGPLAQVLMEKSRD